MTVAVKIDLSQIRAAIFDMDGTMVDNMGYHQQAWKEFLKRKGVKLSDEDLREKISGKKNSEIFKIVFQKELSPERAAAYAKEKETLYRRIYASGMDIQSWFSRILVPTVSSTVHILTRKSGSCRSRFANHSITSADAAIAQIVLIVLTTRALLLFPTVREPRSRYQSLRASTFERRPQYR